MCLTEVVTGASTVVSATDLVITKRNFFLRVFNMLRRRVKVLVYGDSGVGKTQFLLTLTGKDSFTAPQRTRQVRHHDLILNSGRRVRFIDTPGHKSSQVIRNDALDEMARGHVDGIINLVDYGYQDSEQLQKHPEQAFQTGSSIVKEEYLRGNRKLEIERTREVVGRISSKVKVKWFITLINKADVWNDKRDEVIGYYEGGAFKKSMENLEHAVSVTICPFCSVITPFGNKTMQLTYSERNKRRDYDNLIRTLEEYIECRHE